MAYTTIETSHGLTQELWEAGLYKEYLGEHPMAALMGTSEDAIIQVKDDLTKKAGDAITIGIMAELSGSGVTGNTRLKGNEEGLTFYDQRMTIDSLRHGVLLQGKMTQKRVAFDLRNQAKIALKNWLMKKMENDIITALTDRTAGRVRGRYLYGAADSNWSSTHATATATVDGTNDKLTTAVISIAKRKARFGTDIRMRPMKIRNKGKVVEEKFIMFVHDLAARDLKGDTAWSNHQRDLVQGGYRNIPLITGSQFMGEWDGVFVYAYDRIPLTLDGASSIQIAHNLLLGAQAAAIVWGQRTAWAEDIDDYGYEHGFAVDEIRKIDKLVFSRDTPEDHGVTHVYTAAVAD